MACAKPGITLNGSLLPSKVGVFSRNKSSNSNTFLRTILEEDALLAVRMANGIGSRDSKLELRYSSKSEATLAFKENRSLCSSITNEHVCICALLRCVDLAKLRLLLVVAACAAANSSTFCRGGSRCRGRQNILLEFIVLGKRPRSLARSNMSPTKERIGMFWRWSLMLTYRIEINEQFVCTSIFSGEESLSIFPLSKYFSVAG